MTNTLATLTASLIIALFLNVQTMLGQETTSSYTPNKNAHSHNDYLQSEPFYVAHANRFGSMEIDVFLRNDSLYVAHDAADIQAGKTIQRLYLEPLIQAFDRYDGPYAENGELQFLIDLKQNGEQALHVLQQQLQPIRHLFDRTKHANAVRLVITGDVPKASDFEKYDTIFYFDGDLHANYTASQLKRVAFFSAPFTQYSRWNGLGRLTNTDLAKLEEAIGSAHKQGKGIRFWGAPDSKTAWYTFMKLGVDYINTDKPFELTQFLDRYEDFSYSSGKKHEVYQPTYQSDGNDQIPQKIILLISDGAGFNQQWAAATANGGQLNLMRFRNIGFQNNAPADDYNTDSAAGATALASGSKTRNRYIGRDSTGRDLPNASELGIPTAILSNDNATGATPAAFYAHVTDRDQSDSIAQQLIESPLRLLIAGHPEKAEGEKAEYDRVLGQSGAAVYKNLQAFTSASGQEKTICFLSDTLENNYRMLEEAIEPALAHMDQRHDGYFMMVEGAKIDGGGHSNRISQSIDEYLSFDRLIGKALAYADKHPETLVVVTSDHETGGLALVNGSYQDGFVLGEYVTNDHTGTAIPVYAYGPSANLFKGFMQNSDIGQWILDLLSPRK